MIHVEGLTKYYGDHAAISNLSFDIKQGEVIGFLGLNGAGKTTTLKVLGCVLLPTSGRVMIDGHDVVNESHEIRKLIGFLPDTPPLYDEMTVGGYLAFVAQLRGIAAAQVANRVREAEEKTALVDMHDTPISALSHGYRQRVGVAQAMVHKPKLLILDEPTSGLDPAQIVEMRALINKLKGEHTVLVSSHILSEIAQICDRYVVIQGGEIVAQGTEDELSKDLGGKGVIELELRGTAGAAIETIKAVPGIKDVELVRLEEDLVVLRVDADTDARPDIVRALVEADFDVLKVDKATSRLESIFLKLTQGS
jgi:ABC-2 type transport system ATP-binding protein